jgi:hypothetical protein
MAERPFDYLQFLETTHKAWDEARKPRAALWRESWNIYHNQYDWSQKAPWQSKEVVPEFAQTVDTASDLIKRALLEAREFYTVEGEGEDDKAKAPLIKRLTDLWLRIAGFVTVFTDGIKLAGITDLLPLKLTWPEWEEEDVILDTQSDHPLGGLGAPSTAQPRVQSVRRSGLKIELLDPFRVWVDPSGRHRGVIEATVTDLDELRRMAALAPDAWDREEIAKLETALSVKEDEDEQARRMGLQPAPPADWRRSIRVLTYYGDCVDADGTAVGTDMTFAVASAQEIGGQYLVGKPRPMPYWHKILDRRYPNKRGPILWGSLFRIPLSPIGKGFAYDTLGLAKLITAQVNNLVDQDRFAGINAFELDTSAMADPEQLKNGVSPGVVLERAPEMPPDRPILLPRPLGAINPQTLQVLALVQRLYRNGSGVTEFVGTTEPTRQTPTLGEYRGRQSQAMGRLDMIARNLEDQLLEPVLETVYWLILQYMDDFGARAVREALGEDAAQLVGMDAAARFGLLKASVRFRARGLSMVMAKAEEVQKVAMLLQALPALLKVVPSLVQEINWQAIIRKIVEGFAWDPDEVLRQPQQAALEREALAGSGALPGAPSVSAPSLGPPGFTAPSGLPFSFPAPLGNGGGG